VRVVDLKADGKEEKALIREGAVGSSWKELLHVDFARVALDERIVGSVPLEIRGTARRNAGGVLDQPIHTLSIECLAISIPNSIRVAIASSAGRGHPCARSDLPPGVKRCRSRSIVVHVTCPLPSRNRCRAGSCREGGAGIIRRRRLRSGEASKLGLA